MMRAKHLPDHTQRQLSIHCEYYFDAPPKRVYEAWTRDFDLWFAEPGTLQMKAQVDQPYFFYNFEDWGRHPHYGRFLDLEPYKRIEMTWVTGNGEKVGTEGAETVIKIELNLKGEGTEFRFQHSGFVSEQSAKGHEENWPEAFRLLNEKLNRP